MLSTRVLTLLGLTSAYARGTEDHPPQSPHLVPNMLDRVNFWTPSRQAHDLRTLLCQKSTRTSWCVGRYTVLYIRKDSTKHVRHPRKHTISETPDVSLTAGSSNTTSSPQPRWMAPQTMTEGLMFLCVGGVHVSISHPPCLWHTQTWPSLWNSVKRDSSLKTQHPTACLHCSELAPSSK